MKYKFKFSGLLLIFLVSVLVFPTMSAVWTQFSPSEVAVWDDTKTSWHPASEVKVAIGDMDVSLQELIGDIPPVVNSSKYFRCENLAPAPGCENNCVGQIKATATESCTKKKDVGCATTITRTCNEIYTGPVYNCPATPTKISPPLTCINTCGENGNLMPTPTCEYYDGFMCGIKTTVDCTLVTTQVIDESSQMVNESQLGLWDESISVWHYASDIRLMISGDFYTLQSFIDRYFDKNKALVDWTSKLAWHKADDIRVTINGENYSLQLIITEYLDQSDDEGQLVDYYQCPKLPRSGLSDNFCFGQLKEKETDDKTCLRVEGLLGDIHTEYNCTDPYDGPVYQCPSTTTRKSIFGVNCRNTCGDPDGNLMPTSKCEYYQGALCQNKKTKDCELLQGIPGDEPEESTTGLVTGPNCYTWPLLPGLGGVVPANNLVSNFPMPNTDPEIGSFGPYSKTLFCLPPYMPRGGSCSCPTGQFRDQLTAVSYTCTCIANSPYPLDGSMAISCCK